MNEARRFFRYVIPGVLFIVLTFFLSWIVLPECTEYFVTMGFSAENNSLAILIGALFTSGALGYLFATIHHLCHWYLPCEDDIINHTNTIDFLRIRGLIPRIWEMPKCHKPKRTEAVITMSALLFELLDNRQKNGVFETRLAAFGDLAHAAGTARVASCFALVAVILITIFFGEPSLTRMNIIRYIAMLIAGILTICLFQKTYRRTGIISGKLTERVIEDILAKAPHLPH